MQSYMTIRTARIRHLVEYHIHTYTEPSGSCVAPLSLGIKQRWATVEIALRSSDMSRGWAGGAEFVLSWNRLESAGFLAFMKLWSTRIVDGASVVTSTSVA